MPVISLRTHYVFYAYMMALGSDNYLGAANAVPLLLFITKYQNLITTSRNIVTVIVKNINLCPKMYNFSYTV